MGRKYVQHNLSLTPDVDAALKEFCRETHREEGPTLRAIVSIFLRDGLAAAERKLVAGLDAPPETRSVPTPLPEISEAAQREADRLLDGLVPAPRKRAKHAG